MPRDRFQRQSLGALHTLIRQSRILLVGAGGIGCELLKNLVLTGFGEIHVVDLDTIDLSNLNRQFLFRQEHIKKPKATVAVEAASKFNHSHVKLHAHHANIKSATFNLDFFSSFTLIFNALDNLDARRHVNKLCLAAGVPLIESGTTGFNGQVQVISKGRTQCYDCTPKELPKTFPVCTIRSTPSQAIHCIVWAKSYLLPELFGEGEDEDEVDMAEDADNLEEIENLRDEAEALRKIRGSMGTEDFAKNIFGKVFTEDVERLRGMEEMWKSRKPPQSLSYDTLQKEATDMDAMIHNSDQQIWSMIENFTLFRDSLQRLGKRFQDEQITAMKNRTAKPVITFDKDDKDTLDFVTASANLRSAVFGIETKSQFDIKQMAGNIIPAIATTNAMTAGLCVLQAFKVLRGDFFRAKMVYLSNNGARAIDTEPLQPPNPDCAVCGVATSRLKIDPERATLNDLVEDVLKLQLGYGDEFTVNNEIGTVYDPDLDDNLGKKFTDLGIKDESFLTVIDDDEENPRVNLQIAISTKTLPEASKPVILAMVPNIARRPKVSAQQSNGQANGVREGATIAVTVKRKREAEEAELDVTTPAKKGQTEPNGTAGAVKTDEAIVLDDAGEGAIVIEDD